MKTTNLFKKLVAATLAAATLTAPVVTAQAANLISRSKAISIATKDAGVSTKSANYRLEDTDLDTYKGYKSWEVEFYNGGTKYEYEINAKNGKILFNEKEISKTKVKSIAAKKANVDKNKVTNWDIDHIDSKNYYKVSFRKGNYKYSMRVDSATGKVTKYTKNKVTVGTTNIGVTKAKEIALNHAKKQVTIKGDVTYTKARRDYDDGYYQYEIEFYYKGIEFEYEIDAKTGQIIDWDMDYDD